MKIGNLFWQLIQLFMGCSIFSWWVWLMHEFPWFTNDIYINRSQMLKIHWIRKLPMSFRIIVVSSSTMSRKLCVELILEMSILTVVSTQTDIVKRLPTLTSTPKLSSSLIVSSFFWLAVPISSIFRMQDLKKNNLTQRIMFSASLYILSINP